MKIFLAIPFKGEFEDIYELIKSAVSIGNHSIVRAEDFSGDKDIRKKVEEEIKSSDIVIAEISHYETKNIRQNARSEFLLAQTLNKPIIPISDKSTELSIDLSEYQVILYDRLKMQETLFKPIVNYLGKSKSIDFLLKKTNDEKITIKSIFVSYSHVDIEYLNRLKIHLKPFEKKGQIDLWVDTKIKAGEKWKDKIKSALDKSVIAILIISADFLASDFIIENELPPLLKAAEEKGKIILPLIVKPCRFISDEHLSKFQAINDPKIPLSKLTENDREEIYVKVADLIDNLVK
jgi:hypothetical protein